MLGLKFPPIEKLIEWPSFWGDGEWHALNKIGLACLIATAITIAIYMLAARKSQASLVPAGVQNVAEVGIEFIDNQIIDQTMGEEGRGWNPFLLSIFWFVLIGNMFEIVPGWQMPSTARMAIPLILALTIWVAFIGTGIKHQGLGYFGHLLWPPGVPTALKPLVGLIEFVSTIFVTPFSLTVRLMANMLAGHILLVSFALLTHALATAETQQVFLVPMSIFPFLMLVGLTAFEILVSFLQAYIFTILAAVYISNSIAGHGDDH